jgi:hypothetical protein
MLDSLCLCALHAAFNSWNISRFPHIVYQSGLARGMGERDVAPIQNWRRGDGISDLPSNELVIEGKATVRTKVAEVDGYYRVEFANKPGVTYQRFVDSWGQVVRRNMYKTSIDALRDNRYRVPFFNNLVNSYGKPFKCISTWGHPPVAQIRVLLFENATAATWRVKGRGRCDKVMLRICASK